MGKTHLLRQLSANAQQRIAQLPFAKSLPIDGNRVLPPFGGQSSQTRASVANAEIHAEDQLLNSENYDQRKLNNSAELMLEALCKDHSLAVREHSDECLNLRNATPPAAIPVRRESKLDVFARLFHFVFREITLTFDPESVRVRCTKGNRAYTPASFSTGERQIFLLLGKFVANKTPSLFLVDEPTRNLNASLAEKFWRRMEEYRSESYFIYATHHPNFALRDGVDNVFLIQRSEITAVANTSVFASLPFEERREFLGSIPAIVAHEKVLVTEGESDGIDEVLYSYIVQDDHLHVEPLGDCGRVINAVRGIDPWNVIAPDVTLRGLVDSDFRSTEQLDGWRQLGTYVLPYHEVESILCHPDLILAVCDRMLPEIARPTHDQIVDRYVGIAGSNRYDIALKRLTEQLKLRISVSGFQADVVEAINDDDGARAAATTNLTGLRDYVGGLDVTALLNEQLTRLTTAIDQRNVEELLLLVPGKLLLPATRSFYGNNIRQNESVVELFKHHLPNADHQVLQQMREGIVALFPTAAGG